MHARITPAACSITASSHPFCKISIMYTATGGMMSDEREQQILASRTVVTKLTAQERSPITPQRPSVLIVEDDVALRRILRLTLLEAGFAPSDVGIGGEALGLLAGPAPDGVILDLHLSDGQAEAVLERLRAPTSSRPAVVVMSGLSEDEAIRQYGPLGDPFIAKPFDPWALVGMLEQLIRRVDSDTSGIANDPQKPNSKEEPQ